jgi:hypothetical protein
MGTTPPTELICVAEQAPAGGDSASALGADSITEADALGLFNPGRMDHDHLET